MVRITHPKINIWKITLVNFIKVSGCTVIILLFQKLVEICALQVGCFFIIFMAFTSKKDYRVIWNQYLVERTILGKKSLSLLLSTSHPLLEKSWDVVHLVLETKTFSSISRSPGGDPSLNITWCQFCAGLGS